MGRAFEARRKSKEARWDKMSKVFPKLAKTITMAAREGGDDPESNTKLRTAIINAKAENMPKDNIAAAIKRASGKDGCEIKEINYEGKGPHGVLLFIECASDNTNRSIANIKAYFNKVGGQIVQTGSLEFMFDRKSVIGFKKTDEMVMDDIELELIDAGLEELELDGDDVTVYGDFTSFGSLSKAVEDLGIETFTAKLQRIPNNPMEFTDAQIEEIEALIDKLEDDEDVQAVFNNIA